MDQTCDVYRVPYQTKPGNKTNNMSAKTCKEQNGYHLLRSLQKFFCSCLCCFHRGNLGRFISMVTIIHHGHLASVHPAFGHHHFSVRPAFGHHHLAWNLYHQAILILAGHFVVLLLALLVFALAALLALLDLSEVICFLVGA